MFPYQDPGAGPVRIYMEAWAERGVDHGPAFWCDQPGHDGRRLTVASVDYLVRTHAAAAGLDDVSAHDIRHTADSFAIDAGGHCIGHGTVWGIRRCS